MLNDKIEIYNALSEIEGLNVYQKRPVDDMDLPCCVFYRSRVTIDVTLDRNIANQSQSYDISVFATKQSDVDDFIKEIESKMRAMNYVLVSSIDLDDPDNIAHTSLRFNLS